MSPYDDHVLGLAHPQREQLCFTWQPACPSAAMQARKFGVRSAMPGFIARKLCPQLVFVKPDFAKYTAASAATRAIFRDYDVDFEAGSLDEAYLDVTEYCKAHGVEGEQVGIRPG